MEHGIYYIRQVGDFGGLFHSKKDLIDDSTLLRNWQLHRVRRCRRTHHIVSILTYRLLSAQPTKGPPKAVDPTKEKKESFQFCFDGYCLLENYYRVTHISNRIPKNIFFQAKSLDLNPLDYCFWGMAMSKVWENKPKTIKQLVIVVKIFLEAWKKMLLEILLLIFVKELKCA